MIEQEFIMLIMNCKKYMKKADIQKRSWLKDVPPYLKYYHVIGDEKMEENYKFDNEQNILWVKVEDDYNSLPKKVIRAYSAVYETFNFSYLFKTDDDQILINNKFFDIIKKILETTIPKIHYGGYIINLSSNSFSDYHKIHKELPPNLPLFKTKYCSGRFYLLSRSAMSNLLVKQDDIEKEYFEDYAVGYYLGPIFKNNMCSLMTNKFFIDVEKSEFSQWIEGNL